MRYPALARESNIQGQVIVAFIIDKNGGASNYRIKKSLGYGCDEETMRCVKNITGDWLPAMVNGKAVTIEYELPVSFTLGN